MHLKGRKIMEQLATKTDENAKKRRFRIGIILVAVGLLGMLLTALTEMPPQQSQTPPASTVSAEG